MDSFKPPREEFEFLPWPAAPAQQEGEWGLGAWPRRVGRAVSGVVGRVGAAMAGSGIIDLTAQGNKAVRKGARDMRKVHTLVLHQMACCAQRGNPMKDYLGLKAHFAILMDGRILQIHPLKQLIWASNRFNGSSVAVEFAGNFPDTKGRWWQGGNMGRNQVTSAQIQAGRRLVRHLVATMGLRRVVAHRQSSATRENDPGPDIWAGVGQWAIDTLKLSDGGPGYKVDHGRPIPDLWRRWGRTKGGVPAREAELAAVEQFESGPQDEFETSLGPLTATLRWYKRPYSREELVKLGTNVGGVYIAVREDGAGGYRIEKVGMAGTFAQRLGDPTYFPHMAGEKPMRFFLAEVRGNRGNRGIGGVVQMVELALARLLRRSGDVTKDYLPYAVTKVRGQVQIVNPLPEALIASSDRFQRALERPSDLSKGAGTFPKGTATAGKLLLPKNFNWEAEAQRLN